MKKVYYFFIFISFLVVHFKSMAKVPSTRFHTILQSNGPTLIPNQKNLSTNEIIDIKEDGGELIIHSNGIPLQRDETLSTVTQFGIDDNHVHTQKTFISSRFCRQCKKKNGDKLNEFS